jgi:7-cyano-7-deazaguanine reductase
MSTPEDSKLGRSVDWPQSPAPEVLFPIPRATQRQHLGIGERLPFHGVDVWNAWELSWLDPRGKPELAIAELRVPCSSPHLIESKSLKLYLGSFQFERTSRDALRARIVADLSQAAGAPVELLLQDPRRPSAETPQEPAGESIDSLAIDCDHFGPPRPTFLVADDDVIVDEVLTSALFKSNCPVTGQPDWASVAVAYHGPRIDREGLLRYLVSFRDHADFHEHCVERVFVEVMARCRPERLSVYARYTRRGGLDINPYRSTGTEAPANLRTPRQ